MDFTISYAITACNEHQELTELLAHIGEHKRPQDEIVIQLDSNSATPEVEAVVQSFGDLITTLIRHPLNNHFADFKNNLKANCAGDYLFQIDADELPNSEMINNLHLIIGANPEVDLFLVPRVNTVKGYTEEHVKKWNWHINEEGWINWPDYQFRICKNSFNIKWKNKVHEVITGHSTLAQLPSEKKFALFHHKEIKRQERQNEYYEELL